MKKTHPSEQYICVTCGRTDSPEWRKVRYVTVMYPDQFDYFCTLKGPSGPKTLCNACGLRWAKQMRKIDEPGDIGLDFEALREF